MPDHIFPLKRNVEKIGFHWSILGRLEGLYVRQNLINIKVGNNWELLSFLKRVFIPLSCFADNWSESELGQQIKQYAPHLFEQENTARVNL